MEFIKFKINLKEMEKGLTDLEKKHLPFATARALSWSASDSQKEIRRQLPMRYILRNGWTSKGVRMDLSKKKQLFVSVYTLDEYMRKFEDKTDKKPRKSKHLAVPWSINKTKRGIVRQRDYPSKLNKNTVFKIDERTPFRYSHILPDGIYRRVKGGGLSMLYGLEKVGKIDNRHHWKFGETVERVVTQRFDRLFSISLADATSMFKD